MHKVNLNKPVLIYLYGMPGAGKSYLSRHLADAYNLAHISSDKIRSTLYESPRFDKSENQIVQTLMYMMSEQFLKAGIGVIFDMSASRIMQRRALRDLARKNKVEELLIWLQIDPDTAFHRSSNRDKRKPDDKYNQNIDQQTFDSLVKQMQNPVNETGMVVSGKHLFESHKSAIQKRLISLGLIDPEDIGKKVAKPGMVNLVSKAQITGGRVNMSRRNIIIR